MNSVYFKVGDNKFATRREAEKFAKSSQRKEQVQFVSGPILDFSIPRITLKDAIRNRCIQLRDTYNWLQLYYSGGADSHSILASFIENDIPLNEIVMSRWSCNGNWDEIHNSEINHTAIPFIAKNQQYFLKHNVKIFYCDFSYDKIHSLYSDPDFLYRLNSFSITNPGTIDRMIYAYPDLLDHDSLCQIVGWEKPSVYVNNGVVSTFSIDKTTPFIPDSISDSKFEFFFMEDPVVSVTQYRIAKDIIDKFMPTASGIVANSDKVYFTLLNQHARNAAECVISNSTLIGKSFGQLSYKDATFLTHLQTNLPSVWGRLTDFCGSTDYARVLNYCDVAPDNDFRNLTGIIGLTQEIV